MKRVIIAAAFASLSTAALAGPCVALDYQEMKDMSAEELIGEACKVREGISKSFDEGMSNLDYRSGAKPYPDAQQNLDQCSGQSDRIKRVLTSKGVSDESLGESCRAIAAERKAAVDRLRKQRG